MLVGVGASEIGFGVEVLVGAAIEVDSGKGLIVGSDTTMFSEGSGLQETIRMAIASRHIFTIAPPRDVIGEVDGLMAKKGCFVTIFS